MRFLLLHWLISDKSFAATAGISIVAALLIQLGYFVPILQGLVVIAAVVAIALSFAMVGAVLHGPNLSPWQRIFKNVVVFMFGSALGQIFGIAYFAIRAGNGLVIVAGLPSVILWWLACRGPSRCIKRDAVARSWLLVGVMAGIATGIVAGLTVDLAKIE
jgi:hypothetical protein